MSDLDQQQRERALLDPEEELVALELHYRGNGLQGVGQAVWVPALRGTTRLHLWGEKVFDNVHTKDTSSSGWWDYGAMPLCHGATKLYRGDWHHINTYYQRLVGSGTLAGRWKFCPNCTRRSDREKAPGVLRSARLRLEVLRHQLGAL